MEQHGNNYQPVSPQPKDPNTVFLIEMVGGFFGFLGLGYFYVGRTNDGILRLLLWLAYNVTAYIIITLLLAVIIGFFCLPVQLLIQVGIPFWSANTLKNDMLSGKTQ